MFDDEFKIVVCITCGVRHGVPTAQYNHAVEKGGFKNMLYCPNGHKYGWGETENDRIRQERDRLKQQIAYKDDQLALARAEREKAHVERAKAEAKAKKVETRAKAALCPCCNRSFVALRRHMATKHPEHNVVPLKRANA